jgi:hypothetical protein
MGDGHSAASRLGQHLGRNIECMHTQVPAYIWVSANYKSTYSISTFSFLGLVYNRCPTCEILMSGTGSPQYHVPTPLVSRNFKVWNLLYVSSTDLQPPPDLTRGSLV